MSDTRRDSRVPTSVPANPLHPLQARRLCTCSLRLDSRLLVQPTSCGLTRCATRPPRVRPNRNTMYMVVRPVHGGGTDPSTHIAIGIAGMLLTPTPPPRREHHPSHVLVHIN